MTNSRIAISGISILVLTSLSGCFVSDDEAKNFVQKNVDSCGGKVSSVTLSKTGLFSNEYSGFADVSIEGESYTPELKVTSDGFNTVLSLQQNPCNAHHMQLEARRLQYEGEQMQRQAQQAQQALTELDQDLN